MYLGAASSDSGTKTITCLSTNCATYIGSTATVVNSVARKNDGTLYAYMLITPTSYPIAAGTVLMFNLACSSAVCTKTNSDSMIGSVII